MKTYNPSEIQEVDYKFLKELWDSAFISPYKITRYEPQGLFYAFDYEGGLCAVDNSTGDAWTETFSTIEEAISWLNGEFEVTESEHH